MKTALKLGSNAPVDTSLDIWPAVNNCSWLNYISNPTVMDAASDGNGDDMTLEMVTYYYTIIFISISSSRSSSRNNNYTN